MGRLTGRRPHYDYSDTHNSTFYFRSRTREPSTQLWHGFCRAQRVNAWLLTPQNKTWDTFPASQVGILSETSSLSAMRASDSKAHPEYHDGIQPCIGKYVYILYPCVDKRRPEHYTSTKSCIMTSFGGSRCSRLVWGLKYI